MGWGWRERGWRCRGMDLLFPLQPYIKKRKSQRLTVDFFCLVCRMRRTTGRKMRSWGPSRGWRVNLRLFRNISRRFKINLSQPPFYLLCFFCRSCSIKARVFRTKRKDCPNPWWKLFFYSWKEKLVIRDHTCSKIISGPYHQDIAKLIHLSILSCSQFASRMPQPHPSSLLYQLHSHFHHPQ